MRHHDILLGHDYCLILDKLETKLPPWKRIYVEDADACSHVLDPSFCQNGFLDLSLSINSTTKSRFLYSGEKEEIHLRD